MGVLARFGVCTTGAGEGDGVGAGPESVSGGSNRTGGAAGALGLPITCVLTEIALVAGARPAGAADAAAGAGGISAGTGALAVTRVSAAIITASLSGNESTFGCAAGSSSGVTGATNGATALARGASIGTRFTAVVPSWLNRRITRAAAAVPSAAKVAAHTSVEF